MAFEQGAYLFDPAVTYSAADLHDRHRDMRLDVDSMSYEVFNTEAHVTY